MADRQRKAEGLGGEMFVVNGFRIKESTLQCELSLTLGVSWKFLYGKLEDKGRSGAAREAPQPRDVDQPVSKRCGKAKLGSKDYLDVRISSLT